MRAVRIAFQAKRERSDMRVPGALLGAVQLAAGTSGSRISGLFGGCWRGRCRGGRWW